MPDNTTMHLTAEQRVAQEQPAPKPIWTPEQYRTLRTLLSQEPKYVGEKPIHEVEQILRDGASLCFAGPANESNINFSASDGAFNFVVWQGNSELSTTPYETLAALIAGEPHQDFDLSAFEIVS